MEISVEQTSTLERKLRISIPAAKVEEQVNAKLQQLSRQARIPGFRKGKVPKNVIEQRYGGQARSEALEQLINSSYGEALQQEELQPAGQPSIEPEEIKPGTDFVYTATLEVYPEIKLQGLDKIKLDRPVAEVTDADIDEMLETLRKQATTHEAAERAAAEGDQVKIDYTGLVDGEDFPGNTGEGAVIPLVAGELPEPFDAAFRGALIGKSAGDVVKFDVVFPEDFGIEQVKGKTAEYTATVVQVLEAKQPELDDEFAKKFGIAEGGMDKLREDLSVRMRDEAENAQRARLKQAAIDAMLEANQVEVPATLIRAEIGRLRHDALHRMGDEDHASHDPRDHEQATEQLPDELFAGQAEKRVTTGLLFGELIKDRDVKVDPTRVNEQIERMSQQYENPQEIIKAYRSNPQALRQIEMSVLEEQVIDELVSMAEVIDVPMSFSELTQQNNNAAA